MANGSAGAGEKSIWESQIVVIGKKKAAGSDAVPPLTADAHFAADLVPAVIKVQSAREERLEGYKLRAMQEQASRLRAKPPAALLQLASRSHSQPPVRPTRVALEIEKTIYGLFEQDTLPHSALFLDCWRIEAIRLDRGLGECHVAWSADSESSYFTSFEDLSAKLARLSKQIRYMLAQKLALRRVPELSFEIYDQAIMLGGQSVHCGSAASPNSAQAAQSHD